MKHLKFASLVALLALLAACSTVADTPQPTLEPVSGGNESFIDAAWARGIDRNYFVTFKQDAAGNDLMYFGSQNNWRQPQGNFRLSQHPTTSFKGLTIRQEHTRTKLLYQLRKSVGDESLSRRVLEQTYAERKGKYQGQRGVTLPKL